MDVLNENVAKFLDNCLYMKGLSEKTLKAYSIDLKQFQEFCFNQKWDDKSCIEDYIKNLYMERKPKTAKRKIASLKAFFQYLENNDLILINPFHKISIKHKEPIVLPKTIPVETLTKILEAVYKKKNEEGHTDCYYYYTLRDAAIIELLFATGIRVYELCNLKEADINLKEKCIKVVGKGNKERYINVTNRDVINILKEYKKGYKQSIAQTGFFFINNRGSKISEQSVRFMVDKYARLTGTTQHITPHMFRHTFATLLLEEDVDIRYIQELLGHSSITTTQIYTHISMNAQKRVLKRKHPRNKLNINTF